MKKINIILFLIIAAVLQSCLKDDKDIFKESPSARLEQRLLENAETLRSAPNGWIMKFYPEENLAYGGYALFMKFDADNKVTMMSDRGGLDYTETSYYDLVADDGPVLTFNTYNSLLNYFSDPKNEDGIGPEDSGMQGDYEFKLLNVAAQKALVMGKKTGNFIEMVPVPAGVDWKEYYSSTMAVLEADKLPSDYIVVDGENEYPAMSSYRTLHIMVAENKIIEAPFIYLDGGIEFYEPLKIGSHEVKTMKGVINENNILSHFKDETSGLIIYAQEPTIVDLFLRQLWFFKYSEMGPVQKLNWNMWNNAIGTPNSFVMRYLTLGSSAGKATYAFIVQEGTDRPKTGRIIYVAEALGDNIVKLKLDNADDVGYEYFAEKGLKQIFFSYSRKFILTSDDPITNLRTIRFEDTDDFGNWFVLSADEVEYPLTK